MIKKGNWNSLSLKSRLIASIVSVLVILAAIVSYISFEALSSNFSDLTHLLRLKSLSTQALTFLQYQDDTSKKFLMDPESFDLYLDEKIVFYDKHINVLKEIDKQTDDQEIKDFITKLSKLDSDVLREIDSKILENLFSGEVEKSITQYFKQYLPKRKLYGTLIDELNMTLDQKITAAKENLVYNNYLVILYIIVSFSICAFICIALISFLANTIEKNHKNIKSILDNIQQGVFSILPTLKLDSYYSKYLSSILEKQNIENSPFYDVLFEGASFDQNSRDQAIEALKASFFQEEFAFEANSHLLPRALELGNAYEKKHLSIDWSPIVDKDGVIVRIIVVVRNVTDLIALEAKAQANELEAAVISEIIALGKKKFYSGFDEIGSYILKAEELSSQFSDQKSDSIKLILSHLHTLKGVTRIYRLKYLTNVVHQVEEIFIHMAKDLHDDLLLERSRDEIDKLSTAQSYYVEIFKRIFGNSRLDIANDLIEAANDIANSSEYTSKEKYDQIVKILDHHGKVRIEGMIDELKPSLKIAAQSLSKLNPELKVSNDEELMFFENEHQILRDSLQHILTNCIDHGIELPEERKQKGKKDFGLIHISIFKEEHFKCIEIFDDGGGFPLEFLRQQTKNMEQMLAEVSELMFSIGFSTKEKESVLSGRGVGMYAVKNSIQKELKGDVSLVNRGLVDKNHLGIKIKIKIPI